MGHKDAKAEKVPSGCATRIRSETMALQRLAGYRAHLIEQRGEAGGDLLRLEGAVPVPFEGRKLEERGISHLVLVHLLLPERH